MGAVQFSGDFRRKTRKRLKLFNITHLMRSRAAPWSKNRFVKPGACFPPFALLKNAPFPPLSQADFSPPRDHFFFPVPGPFFPLFPRQRALHAPSRQTRRTPGATGTARAATPPPGKAKHKGKPDHAPGGQTGRPCGLSVAWPRIERLGASLGRFPGVSYAIA